MYMVICLVFFSLFTIEGEQGFLNKFWISLNYKVFLPFSHCNLHCWNSTRRWKKKNKRMKGKVNYQICLFKKCIKKPAPSSRSKFTLHYYKWPRDEKIGSWSWLLTKGRDQENYLSRPLVTSVKRPWDGGGIGKCWILGYTTTSYWIFLYQSQALQGK
jgi:hypothetical protein